MYTFFIQLIVFFGIAIHEQLDDFVPIRFAVNFEQFFPPFGWALFCVVEKS